MRIGHYLHAARLDLGGPVRAALDLCSGFADDGHDVTLITNDDRDVPGAWKEAGCVNPRVVRLPRVPSLFGTGDRDAMRLVNEYIDELDVLHLHGVWRPDNVPVAAAARRLGCPYVFSTHGTIDDWSMSTRRPRKRLFLFAFGRRMLERAAAVHCTAREEFEQARKWFPRGRGEVIPLLIDLEPFRVSTGKAGQDVAAERPSHRGAPFRILFLSLLHPVKGVELLLEAASDLEGRGAAFELVIAGSGEPRYVEGLERMATDLGIDDRVRFVGFVSGDEKVSIYRSADVFCLPSTHENFGLVWAEALAAGTPVITTRGVGVWRDLEAGGGARIVDRTPTAFADTLAELIADPARARALGERGCEWVFSFLDPKRVVSRFLELYAGAAEGAARRTGAEGVRPA